MEPVKIEPILIYFMNNTLYAVYTMSSIFLRNSIGKYYGYPDCCILEFMNSHPADFIGSKKTEEMKQKYKELTESGQYSEEVFPELANYMKLLDKKKYELELKRKVSNKTGFIPCKSHAEQIQNGTLRLEDLIQNRKHEFPFPNGKLKGSEKTKSK